MRDCWGRFRNFVDDEITCSVLIAAHFLYGDILCDLSDFVSVVMYYILVRMEFCGNIRRLYN